jgi:hypothetical protein
VILTNLRHNLLNFLAQRLNGWADFLREESEVPNSKLNLVEPPENLLPHEDWLRRAESKPPQDWLERVSRGAPELLLNMPEFIVQTTESSATAKPSEPAETEISPDEISVSKNVAATKAGQEVQLIKKPQANLPLQNFANKADSKRLFSPLFFFKLHKETSHKVELTGTDSVKSDDSTKFADKNVSQNNSNFIGSKLPPLKARQTSIIRFNPIETKSVNESSLGSSKTDKGSAKNLFPTQIIESRRSPKPTRNHKQIEAEQKSDLTIKQQIFGLKVKSAVNEHGETKTNRIETAPTNFILSKQNHSDERQTVVSSFIDKKDRAAKPNNLFSEETIKIPAPKPLIATLRPQENQWADLPQLAETEAESSDKFEVFSQKNKHLRSITFEQTGGGWNE